jgi:hypothetical protein
MRVETWHSRTGETRRSSMDLMNLWTCAGDDLGRLDTASAYKRTVQRKEQGDVAAQTVFFTDCGGDICERNPPPPVTTGRSNMNLADAMRTGAARGPQAVGSFFRSDGGMCALGAAADACAILPVDLARRFPELAIETIVCPVCLQVDSLWTTITALNDNHHWTREAIADWLDDQVLDLSPVAIVAMQEQPS